MGYRFVDHTAELQLELEAPSEEGVFREAVAALGELLSGDARLEGGEETRDLRVEATDDPALLAAWLEELVFLAETEGLVPVRVTQLDLVGSEVRAAVSFRRGSPAHLVKGVTYHDLALAREGGEWRARVVLDV
jgi:SHS2 domain-containing protein